MARHREPWIVIDSRPTYWYYKLAPWDSYRSTGIRKRYSKSGNLINRREAQEFAREQWERHKVRRDQDTQTLRQMLRPYFVWGECPHITRVVNDGETYTQDYAKWQRRRLELYVLTDPIADMIATELTPGDIEDWKRRQRDAGVGTRTLNMTLGALSTAYKEEMHRNPRALAFDPTAPVSIVKGKRQEFGIYSLSELRRMFASPDPWGYRRQHPGMKGNESARMAAMWQAFTFALAYFQLGERPSALLRLHWGSIQDGAVHIAETKTASARSVPVPRQLSEALDEMRDLVLRIADSDPIWCYDDGRPRGPDWFDKRWAAMMRALELPANDVDGRKRTPYSLKRSLITHLIDAGENPVLVREWVGHAHTGAVERALTPAQSRYKVRQSERLEALRPAVEGLLSPG